MNEDLNLVKPVGEKHRYAFSASSMPPGYAGYTCSAIHCDRGPSPPWMIGYANAEDFSTVIFRTEDSHTIVDIRFAQPDTLVH